MNKMRYIISIIIGVVVLVQLCGNTSWIMSADMVFGNNMVDGMTMGFKICTVLIVIMLSIFILQNVANLVIELVYGEEHNDGDIILGMLDKASRITNQVYRIAMACMFGAMGIFAIWYYMGMNDGGSALWIVGSIFVLFALVLCIQSIRAIIRIIRE